MDTNTTQRTDPVALQLLALRERYSYRINAAVAAGRYELAEELADAYPNEALQLLTTHVGGLGTGRQRARTTSKGRRARAAAGLARTRWAWSGVAAPR